ncbi:unnamed protein product [Paramecium primaurelia]|uniref:Uncharacterized protein n=1 Tax=Paramecium primaurelia TaxID=5886 RepID=A0A8S1QF73_PARPR|nr:unnamed protein product [Paramecium primaurelia]
MVDLENQKLGFFKQTPTMVYNFLILSNIYCKQEVFKNPMQEDGLINFTQEDIQYLSLVHLFQNSLCLFISAQDPSQFSEDINWKLQN